MTGTKILISRIEDDRILSEYYDEELIFEEQKKKSRYEVIEDDGNIHVFYGKIDVCLYVGQGVGKKLLTRVYNRAWVILNRVIESVQDNNSLI